MLVAVFLGVMFTQTGFIGHDAGHRQISGSKRTDDVIGRIHGNLLIGLSFGWWTSKHNRHHAHPNQVGRDPDIGGRAIAFTPDQARERGGLGRLLAGYQAWLFFPMLLLEGLHLHVAGFRTLLGGRSTTVKLVDGTLLAAHIIGYLTAVFLVLSPVQAVAFLLIQQGVFGRLPGLLVRAQSQGHGRVRGGREGRFPPPPGRHLAEHPRQLVHRLRPRRPQLPDRASPVPLHAAAQPAAGPGAGARVLRAARHRLPRDWDSWTPTSRFSAT